MADVKSNAELDIKQVSRDGAHSTYVATAPDGQDADAGPAVQQVLGTPAPASDKGDAEHAARAAAEREVVTSTKPPKKG